MNRLTRARSPCPPVRARVCVLLAGARQVIWRHFRVGDAREVALGSLLFVTGPSFQRVGMLAIEHDLTSLVMHRRPRGYDARVSLRCQLGDFELGIQRIPRMYLLQKSTRGTRKCNKHVADVLWKQGGTRSSEGENLQSMHHRSGMPVSARVLDIVVDRVIVSRDRLESGGMRIR